MEGIPTSKLQTVLQVLTAHSSSLKEVQRVLQQLQSPDKWKDALAQTSFDRRTLFEADNGDIYFTNVRNAIKILEQYKSGDFTPGGLDLPSAWNLVKLSFHNRNKRADIELFLSMCHMLAAGHTHNMELSGLLHWKDIYCDTDFNRAISSDALPKEAQAKHYIQMAKTCSPLLLKDSHVWGKPPVSVLFLSRALELVCQLQQPTLLKYIACLMSYYEEMLDYQSKLCWVEDSECENPALLLSTLKQVRMLAFLTPKDLKKYFTLPDRLHSCIEMCLRNTGEDARDEYALQLLKELWGIRTELERSLGIENMCVSIGILAVGEHIKALVVRITEGIPNIPEPLLPRCGWLARQIAVGGIISNLDLVNEFDK